MYHLTDDELEIEARKFGEWLEFEPEELDEKEIEKLKAMLQDMSS